MQQAEKDVKRKKTKLNRLKFLERKGALLCRTLEKLSADYHACAEVESERFAFVRLQIRILRSQGLLAKPPARTPKLPALTSSAGLDKDAKPVNRGSLVILSELVPIIKGIEEKTITLENDTEVVADVTNERWLGRSKKKRDDDFQEEQKEHARLKEQAEREVEEEMEKEEEKKREKEEKKKKKAEEKTVLV
jgi:hypothetical protein